MRSGIALRRAVAVASGAMVAVTVSSAAGADAGRTEPLADIATAPCDEAGTTATDAALHLG